MSSWSIRTEFWSKVACSFFGRHLFSAAGTHWFYFPPVFPTVQVCLFHWLAALQMGIWSALLTNPGVHNRLSLVYWDLQRTTEPSCPTTFKLTWPLFSLLTVSLGLQQSWWALDTLLPFHKRSTQAHKYQEQQQKHFISFYGCKTFHFMEYTFCLFIY